MAKQPVVVEEEPEEEVQDHPLVELLDHLVQAAHFHTFDKKDRAEELVETLRESVLQENPVSSDESAPEEPKSE